MAEFTDEQQAARELFACSRLMEQGREATEDSVRQFLREFDDKWGPQTVPVHVVSDDGQVIDGQWFVRAVNVNDWRFRLSGSEFHRRVIRNSLTCYAEKLRQESKCDPIYSDRRMELSEVADCILRLKDRPNA